jgi:hypothetical protein
LRSDKLAASPPQRLALLRRGRGDFGEMTQESMDAAKPLARLFPLPHRDKVLIGTQLCSCHLLLQEAHEPRGIGEAVVVEAQHRAFGSCFHFRRSRIAAEALDRDDFEKVLDFARQRTEAIAELGGADSSSSSLALLRSCDVAPQFIPIVFE